MGASWGHLGPSWSRLGVSCGRLDAFCGRLGAVLASQKAPKIAPRGLQEASQEASKKLPKMIAKTRSEHGVARPILCRKKTWNLLFFHWFFKLFSFQDDRRHPPQHKSARGGCAPPFCTIPPPDLPPGCKFILRSQPQYNVPRRDKIAKALPVIRQPSAQMQSGTIPLQTSPFLRSYPAEPT